MKHRPITLGWNGKPKSFASEDPGPNQLAKTHGSLSWTSSEDGRHLVVSGDNLAGLRALKGSHRSRVTLAYLDPPFFTQRTFEAVTRGTRERREAFDDRWMDRADYLDALAQRLSAVRELLAPHGSVVVHIDSRTSHYVKVIGDEIFGEDAFASEIVWRYRRWPSKTDNFQRVHDVLLRFRKDPKTPPRWNTLYEPLAASTVATWGTGKQRAVFDKEGKRLRSSTTEQTTAGVPMGDVWDIGVIAPVSRERTGYPSQKPQALLERLVLSLSDPGDTVLDPYAGSGTTLVVAAQHGRRFIGIDQSPVALETTFTRLRAAGVPIGARQTGS